MVERVDILSGGFPCQDISSAGKRTGLSGKRSGLWREMLQAIRLVRPKYAVVENVAALLCGGMGTVLGDLAESGLCCEWDCLPAVAFGAPHTRDRVFIVASDAVRGIFCTEQERERDQMEWGQLAVEYGENRALANADSEPPKRTTEPLEALRDARMEMTGLASYLVTCDDSVIIENLPSLVKSLHLTAAIAEAAIQQAERT